MPPGIATTPHSTWFRSGSWTSQPFSGSGSVRFSSSLTWRYAPFAVSTVPGGGVGFGVGFGVGDTVGLGGVGFGGVGVGFGGVGFTVGDTVGVAADDTDGTDGDGVAVCSSGEH